MKFNKKLIFLVILIGLSIGSMAWGATYYVRDVDGTLKYRSGAIPDADNGSVPSPNDLNQLHFDIGDGHTVVYTAGTYSGTQLDATDGIDIGKVQTIRSMTPSDPSYSTYGGTVTWDCTGLSDHCFVNTVNVTIQGNYPVSPSVTTDFVIRGADATKGGVAPGTSGTTLTLTNVTLDGNAYGFIINGGASIVINGGAIINSSSFAGDVNGDGSSLTTRNVIVRGNAGPIRHYRTTYTDSNSNFVGQSGVSVLITGNNSQTATMYNTLFLASDASGTGVAVLNNDSSNGSGQCINCRIPYAPLNRSVLTTNWTLTNPIYASPKLTANRRPAIISIVIDDAQSANNAVAVAALAESFGWRITWAVDTNNMDTAKWAAARALVASGHEIASHMLDTAVDATALTAPQLAAAMSDSKAAIETQIPGYTVRTIVYPGYNTDATVRAAALAAGYTGGRAGTANSETYLLAAIKRFHTYGYLFGNAFGLKSESPTETQIRGRAASLIEHLGYNGGWMTLLGHDNASFDTDMTIANLTYAFSEMRNAGITVMPYGDAAAWVAANAESTSGSGGELVYVRSETHLGDAADYRPTASSPLCSWGIWIGASTSATDAEGVAWHPRYTGTFYTGAYKGSCASYPNRKD